MKKIWLQRFCMVLFVLTLATCCLMSGTYAKYTATVSGNDTVEVARFLFTASDGSTIYQPSDVEINLFADTHTDAVGTVGNFDGADWDVNPDGLMIAPGVSGKFYIVLDGTTTDVDLEFYGSNVNSVIFQDYNGNKIYDRSYAAEPFEDQNGNGFWDSGEPYTDLDGNGVYTEIPDYYTDANENNCYDYGEPFYDADGDGQFDGAETYTDINGNHLYDGPDGYDDLDHDGGYDFAEEYVDGNVNGQYDVGEEYIDADGDDEYDYAEPITWDNNSNGIYDAGEPFDDKDGDRIYDEAYWYTDSNGNGYYDYGESFIASESFTDWNGNYLYDAALSEPYEDTQIENGKYDVGEPYTDWNENGIWDVYAGENYTDGNGNGKYDGGETKTSQNGFCNNTNFISFRIAYSNAASVGEAKTNVDSEIGFISYEVRTSVEKFDSALTNTLRNVMLEKLTASVLLIEYEWLLDEEGDFDTQDSVIGRSLTSNTYISTKITVTASQVMSRRK